MCAIVDESGYVILGHLWELFLEDALQASQNDQAFTLVIVVDDSEFDLAISFFDDCGLERVSKLRA